MVNGGIAEHKESLLPDPVHFLKPVTSSNIKWLKSLSTIIKVKG